MSNTKKAINTTKEVFDIGSHLHTAISAGKMFLFGKNAGSDADSSKEGLQAHHKGKGRVDEALFREAFAKAKQELIEEGVFNSVKEANTAGKRVTDIFGKLPVQVRADLILDIGIGEQITTETHEQEGVDSKGKSKPDKKVERAANLRGIIICKDLLTMTPTQIQSWIHATVNGEEYFEARVNQLNDTCAKINESLTEKKAVREAAPDYVSTQKKTEQLGDNPLSLLKLAFRRKK